jgi:hypothetical protein
VTGDEEDGRGLAAAVLEEEARRETTRAPTPALVLPDDLLPGVGEGEAMPLREALHVGGWATVVTIGLAGAVAGFDNTALAVLSPDIQDTSCSARCPSAAWPIVCPAPGSPRGA